jgi:preprotein translocase subunit Sec63
MKGDRWKLIDQARSILGLPEKVTRNEIREAYRRASRQIHPDHSNSSEEDMARLNAAYRLLMEYSDSYRISLKPNEDGMNDTEWWMYHFGQDPIWGGEKEE